MTIERNNDDVSLVEALKASAESLHDSLEEMGEPVASKSRSLRLLYAQLLKRIHSATKQPPYFARFQSPLNAVLTYLHLVGRPVKKLQAIQDIADGGFVGQGDGPKSSLRDSIDHQTKPRKNGRGHLLDDGTGLIRLTEKGQSVADSLLESFGRPESQ